MKRRKKLGKRNILIVLAAFVLLVGGFFLPEWVFGIQNRKIQTTVETYTMENGSFHVANQLIQKANALADNYMLMDLYNGMQPLYSKSEILELGTEIVQLFTPWVLDESDGAEALKKNITNWYADPELIVLSKENLSFIVWNLYMETEEINYNITIDDATGKMLAYTYYYIDEPYTSKVNLDEEIAAEWIKELPEIFRSYYEIEEVNQKSSMSNRNSLDQSGWGSAMMGIAVYQMKDRLDSAEIYCHFGREYGDINIGSN